MLKTALHTNIIPNIWKLANIFPIPKPNKDIDKDTSYRPIYLLSLIENTLEKSLLPYITANIRNLPHATRVQNTIVNSDGTTHSKQHRSKGGSTSWLPPSRTITVALDMSKGFETIHTYTHLSESCYRPTFQAQSLSSSQTTSRDAKHTQHIEITHPHNVNSILAFPTLFTFHQHYSTYTWQTYHHQEHQFRSWPTQKTSPSHLNTQVRVQQGNIYNHTYIQCLHGQNKTISH